MPVFSKDLDAAASTALEEVLAKGSTKGAVMKFVDLVKHFFFSIYTTRHGKVLLTAWGSAIVGWVIVALKRHRARQAKRREQALQAKALAASAPCKPAVGEAPMATIRRMLRLLFPTVWNTRVLHVAVYTAVLCIRIWLTLKIASVTGKLGSYMGKRNWTEMFRLQAIFSLWCFPAALVNSLMKYFENKIGLLLRSHLTAAIHEKYLSENRFYTLNNAPDPLKLSQLDQRIADDVRLFCDGITHLYGHILKPLLDILFVSRDLALRMGARSLLGFFVYYFVVNQALAIIKPNFSALTQRTQELEGDFRSQHGSIIAYSQEIALARGGDRERVISDGLYRQLETHRNQALNTHLIQDTVDQYVLKYGGSMMAYSALIPSVYLSMSSVDSHDVTAHYLTCTQMLVSLGGAIKDLALSYKTMDKVIGLFHRVEELFERLGVKLRSSTPVIRRHNQPVLIFQNATIATPYLAAYDWPSKDSPMILHEKNDDSKVAACETKGGAECSDDDEDEEEETETGGQKEGLSKQRSKSNMRKSEENKKKKKKKHDASRAILLVKDLNMMVQPGQHVYIYGSNGSGKSSILRTMGELWPLAGGIISLPPPQQLYFVSQSCYMCPGTLRDQLTYPMCFEGRGHQCDAKLKELLALVQLERLLERYNFDSVQNWGDILSGGEKQRIVLVRLYFHAPKFAILDEATNAISVDMRTQVFEYCEQNGITMVTIAHDNELRRYHKFQLSVSGTDASWKFEPIEQEQQL